MKTRTLDFQSFSVNVAERWDDITSTLDDSDPPLTLADPESGVGALQFSPAIYQSGRLPGVTTDDLTQLLDEFAANRHLKSPFDRQLHSAEILLVGQSFHGEDDYIRVWYASDGKSVMLITYVCNWDEQDIETQEREMTVQSIRFLKP